MKKFLPLMAAGTLLAACSGHCDDGHCDKHNHSGATYHHGDYDRDHGKISSKDPLSERSLGSMRGHHNEYWENSRGPGNATHMRRGYYYDDPTYVYVVPRYNYYYYPGSYWRR